MAARVTAPAGWAIQDEIAFTSVLSGALSAADWSASQDNARGQLLRCSTSVVDGAQTLRRPKAQGAVLPRLRAERRVFSAAHGFNPQKSEIHVRVPLPRRTTQASNTRLAGHRSVCSSRVRRALGRHRTRRPRPSFPPTWMVMPVRAAAIRVAGGMPPRWPRDRP